LSNSASNRKPTVLIAEKDHIVALDLKSILQKWGFEEAVLATSLDNLFQRARESYDLVILDQNCRDGSDWLPLVSRLFGKYRSVVVFLSDFLIDNLPDTLKEERSFHFLRKPFNYIELEHIVCGAIR